MSRFRPHAAWAALGVASVACLWWAWSLPGGLGMFVCIGLAFLMWYRMGSRGSWVALAVVGLGMGGVLGWEAVSGSRCPAADTKVFLRVDRAPVGCDEIRASAAVMGSLFGLMGLVGLAVPFYTRGGRDELEDEASSPAGA